LEPNNLMSSFNCQQDPTKVRTTLELGSKIHIQAVMELITI